MSARQIPVRATKLAHIRAAKRASLSRKLNVVLASYSERYVAVNVQCVEGTRLRALDDSFQLEFLLRVDGSENPVWVQADSIAEDIRFEYEESWWRCCRKGDTNAIKAMLKGGGHVLAGARDADDRSALHYACGIGDEDFVRAVIAHGADLDSRDKESFTPLHIAAGYMHEKVIAILVQSGADPELQDKSGRSPLDLVEALKLGTPATTVTFARRSVLESISKMLEQFIYVELPPAAIIDCRTTIKGQKEYLVQWLDGHADSWVSAKDIADDVIEDFHKGVEYAQFSSFVLPATSSTQEIRDRCNRYLVKWEDTSLPSWEPSTSFNRSVA